jgi:hypothetical protein
LKITSLAWLIVPGFGQIRGGAPGVGVLIFALFILALNGYFLTSLLTAREDAPLVLGIAAAALWLVSLIDGLRRIARTSS